jgi:tetracycline resistance efflux pump
MYEPSALSLLPPLLAIALAIATRQVVLSLGGGIWLGYCLFLHTNPVTGLAASIEGVIAVFQDSGNTKVIIFTLLVGGWLATMESSGGVKGFVQWLEGRRWVDSPRRAQFMAWGIGIVIFIESNITLLVAGAVSRPLFDRMRISREKLAYIIDSTSAPICILIPFNAWGAFNLGLIASTGESDSLGVFFMAIPLNLYAITAVALAAFSIISKHDIGPMRAAAERTRNGQLLWPDASPMVDPSLLRQESDSSTVPRAINMILPVATMLLAMPAALLITGGGDISAGSGSTSVLWAILCALLVSWLCVLSTRSHSVSQLTDIFFKGAGGLVPVAVILLLSMALGSIASALQGGQYLASVIGSDTPTALLLPLLFLISAAIAFAIGSSWGTFAIMIPIALPIAVALGFPSAPFLAAVLSGAIFGDHASPISDTTIVASMAAATDHIDHVRTQLPYALIAGAISTVGFVIMGWVISA